MSVKSPDTLVFAALGGVGEIGMNLGLYGLGSGRGRAWIAVDMGVSFATAELPGVDAVYPDITFLERRKQQLLGIVITHAHEDHIGALLAFWPRLGAPVYMTPFAAGLLAAKRAGEPGSAKVPVTIVKQGGRFDLGPFNVEFVPVSHSIPESNALAIRTPLGLVVHTGDWKLDPTPIVGVATDENRLAALGQEGVTALVCDSTNAIREGVSPSESQVAVTLERMIDEAPHRVAVTTFASNVARIRSVASAALRAGRDVVIVGRAIRRSVDVATELGYLDGLPPFLDQDAYGYLPREKVVALMTGSQGEPRAALARIASNDNRAVALSPGDRVIFSSRTIPGNEKSVNGIINALVDKGVEVITDRDALVHVSGHPRRDELKQMYDWTKPRLLVPVHGEALHLHEQAKLARSCGVPLVAEIRNGDVLRLAPNPVETIEKIPAGRMYRDGKLLVLPDDSGASDRRRLSFAGHVAVSVVLSVRGELLDDPKVEIAGLPAQDEAGDTFRAIVEDAVDDAIDAVAKAKRRDPGHVRDRVQRAVRGEVDASWGKKPVVSVLVTYVGGEN